MKKLLFLVSAAVAAVGSLFAANRIIDISDSEKVQVFDEPGNYTWVAPNNLVGNAQLLVVGGGGAGGGYTGGGGGGGEVVYASEVAIEAGTGYSVVVGAGGKGSSGKGGNGDDSSLSLNDSIIAIAKGGGGGGGGYSPMAGSDGANGGGAGGNGNKLAGAAGQPTAVGGHAGAEKPQGTNWSAGGGGGMAHDGYMYNDSESPGCGGEGVVYAITDNDKMYGYGGGACRNNNVSALSGARNEYGRGWGKVNTEPTAGENGTGGGGGGGTEANTNPKVNGADGGCGTVIIRYVLDTAKDDFSADITRSIKVPTTVTFTAQLGTELSTMTWDFGDGSAAVETTELSVSHEYAAAGKYTVTMTHGAQTVKKENYIEIVSGTLFVDANSKNPQPPYDTRETAATKVTDAIAYAENGFEVRIAPGEYELRDVFPSKDKDGKDFPAWGGSGSWNSCTITMFLTNAITVVGEGVSPSDVIIRSVRRRNYYKDMVAFLDNPKALLANVTLADGSTSNQGYGGSAWITANGGTISNCVVQGGSASIPVQAKTGGVYMSAGLVTHTIFEDCTFDETKYGNLGNARLASAAIVTGTARIENCLFRNCGANVGDVVALSGGNASLVNCTIAGCQIGCWTGNNNVTNDGFAVGTSEGVVRNCAVCNVKRVAYNDNPETYDCAFGPTLTRFTACVKAEKSDFKNYEAGDFTPAVCKALYDAGDDTGISATDLAGNPRLFNKHVDIGCYESQRVAGLLMIVK